MLLEIVSMWVTVRMRATVLCTWAILVGLSALAADARGDGGVDAGGDDASGGTTDGGQSCVDSGDCYAPTPYCDPGSHTCVECLSSRNCADGVCDTTRHTCTGCLSQADCPATAPYCDPASHGCVECLTDKNCEPLGVACLDGECGRCGDGICSAEETISLGFLGPDFPGAPGGGFTVDFRVECREDCEAQCPTKDLGSALGDALASVEVADLRDLFANDCSAGGGHGPDASFLWTAPHSGQFVVDRTASTQSSLFMLFDEGCAGFENVCSGGPGQTPFDAMEGQSFLLVVDTDDEPTGSYVIGIHEVAPEGQAPGDDGGKVDETVASLCIDNAAARGEPVCDEGTRCACEHCPRDYNDCAVIPGCAEIRACMAEKGCIGADCYNSGACRSIIDTYQGVSGPAFRAGVGLQSCALTFGCELPCPGADAGTTPRPDGGRLCAPGREVVCSCDGGTDGTQRCNAGGDAFSPCVCSSDAGTEAGTPKKSKSDSSCGCRIGEAPESGHAAFAALALGLALAARRKRRGGRLLS